MANETILLVDDEINVLTSISRSLLEDDFSNVKTAQSGQEALEITKKMPSVAVVVSDYHMPGMNGIDFLIQMGSLAPDTSRILLTGVADLEMAINAVNRGNIFRFLVKPCPTDVLITAVKDGIRYNQLIVGERELLSKTLNGSIKVMVDILAVQTPSIFSQASRLRKMARELANLLRMEDQLWETELAALLCQIGAVTIPRDILDKWQKGTPLKESEADMIRSIPRTGRQLIKNIPRLEKVAEAVGYQNLAYVSRGNADNPVGDAIPIIARILKVIVDYDRLNESTHNPGAAIQMMLNRQIDYDPAILALLRTRILRVNEPAVDKKIKLKIAEKSINIEELGLGMVLSRDVTDKNGILIVTKGTIITEVLMYKLRNYFRAQETSASIYVEST